MKALKRRRKTLRSVGKLFLRSSMCLSWYAEIIIFIQPSPSSTSIAPNELSSRSRILCDVMFIQRFDSVHFDCVTRILRARLWKTRLWIFHSSSLKSFGIFFFYVLSFLLMLMIGQWKLYINFIFNVESLRTPMRTSYAHFSTLAIHDDDLTFVWCFRHLFSSLRFIFLSFVFLLFLVLTRVSAGDRKRDFHI